MSHHVGDHHDYKEYTHTEMKAPVIQSMSPVIASGVSGLAEELVSHGGTTSTARVSASAVPIVHDTPELRQKSAEDNARYQREQVSSFRQHAVRDLPNFNSAIVEDI
ncbi:CAHS13 [Ramazzottius varieornatus]|uniref:CAHS13 n=1 Tax=Ramazzottius varieornatus TaxID=947166 RepID=A0A1D1VVD2_RAMVA|nr:CAHS13 [Ramazzottius varieornatus]